MNEIDKAYLAGFVDGEGSICIRKRPKRLNQYEMYVSVTNTNNLIPLWLKEEYGGSLGRYPVSNGNGKDRYMWQVSALKAKDFLIDIAPYLKQKKEHAKIALEFQDNQYRGMGFKKHEIKHHLFEKAKKLNRKGKAMANLAA